MIPIKKKSKVSERQLKALDYRQKGFSFKEIARLLGYYDASGARKAVARAGRQILIETTENFRNHRYEQLEKLKRQYMPRALAGDLKSAYLVASIVTKEAKLMGAWGFQEEKSIKKKNDRTVLIWDSSKTSDREE